CRSGVETATVSTQHILTVLVAEGLAGEALDTLVVCPGVRSESRIHRARSRAGKEPCWDERHSEIRVRSQFLHHGGGTVAPAAQRVEQVADVNRTGHLHLLSIVQNVFFRLTMSGMSRTTMQAINLNRLAYFAAVVDAGSFTRAAERLGITKTVVSQQVARLEAEVGVNLLVRTTRRVQPTEAGRMLHSRSVAILREAGDAFSELAHVNAAPRGTLRVTAPNDYGTSVVAPVMATFVARHPACQVELLLSDAKIDLISHQIDLSVRVGWLEDSGARARRIGVFQQLLVATPALLRRFPTAEPNDLTSWPFVANTA